MIKDKLHTRILVVRLALLLIIPWLFLGGPGYEASRSFKEAWNLGHVLLFFLALEFERGLKSKIAPTGTRALAILVLLLSAAVLIEIVQSLFPGRIMSFADVVYSIAGALAGLLWLFSLNNCGYRRRCSLSAAFFLLTLVAVPLFRAGLDDYRASRDFPLLADFESSLEVSRWEKNRKIKRVTNPVSNGNWSLEVVMGIEKYPGIALHYFPGNWVGMKELRFQVFNPGEPVSLNFRVHDREHRGENKLYENRFNGRQLLASGWNQIVVPMTEIESGPLDRKMDLDHIEGFGIFLADNLEERVLYLDRVELIAEKGMP